MHMYVSVGNVLIRTLILYNDTIQYYRNINFILVTSSTNADYHMLTQSEAKLIIHNRNVLKFQKLLIEYTKTSNYIPIMAFKLDKNPPKTFFNVVYLSHR